jgi:hypothetical protein
MPLLCSTGTAIGPRLGLRLGSATRIRPRLGSRLSCWGGVRRNEFSGSATTQDLNNLIPHATHSKRTVNHVNNARQGPSETCFFWMRYGGARYSATRKIIKNSFKILRIEITSSWQWECIESKLHGYRSIHYKLIRRSNLFIDLFNTNY